MKNQHTFKRCEKKYVLPEKICRLLIKDMQDEIEPDKYAEYTIRNIYFDTDNYSLIRESLEKPVYKEKLRLRSYKIPAKTDRVFVEVKKKFDGVVYKRRVDLSYEEAMKYLYEGQLPQKDGQVLHELNWFLQCYKVHPVIFLAYDRLAFHGKEDKNLRITFDKAIRCREKELVLDMDGDCETLMEPDEWVMEIKVNGAMPLWLSRLLSKYKVYPTSFSKYGTYYRQRICSRQACVH